MSKEGASIENFDPKPAIKRIAETARDWEYHEEAEYLYRMAVLFKDGFLDPILHTDRRRLPDPVISFDDARNRKVLASYTLHRNPQGLLDEITFNTVHHEDQDGKKFGSSEGGHSSKLCFTNRYTFGRRILESTNTNPDALPMTMNLF